MKTTALLLLCFVFTANFCSGQNLVPNPSFEIYTSCPNSTNQLDSCVGWQRVHKSPDYFSVCAPYPVSIPDNVVGSQEPFDGNSYAGLYTYIWSQFYREIIGAKLTASLVPGKNYNVSMRVSRGNWTNMAYNCAASNKIGIRFTTFSYSSIDTPIINNQAQLYTDSIITDTANWILLSWDFIADSAYTHIYIGNFFDDNNTDTLVIDAPLGNFGQAYYYIDSVQIYCSDNNCITATDGYDNSAYNILFYADSKLAKIDAPNAHELSVYVLTTSGKVVKSFKVSETSTVDFSDLSNGIYIVKLQTFTQFITRKIFIN